jgi:hypothetical protein
MSNRVFRLSGDLPPDAIQEVLQDLQVFPGSGDRGRERLGHREVAPLGPVQVLEGPLLRREHLALGALNGRPGFWICDQSEGPVEPPDALLPAAYDGGPGLG